jgi:2-hydroxy-6-oxonona-2,4-dienedioate hydrolase
MTMLKPSTIAVAGLATHVLSSDKAKAAPALFVHGGSSGLTPFCSGAHIWRTVLDDFTTERQVIAPDMPGSGRTPIAADEVPTIDSLGKHVIALLQAADAGPCHFVGHDDGGLVGLWLALNAPELLKSVTVVASRTAAPAGDGMPVLTLNNPPQPLWSKISQAWVFEQISYSYAHVTDALLADCVTASEGAPHGAVIAGRASDAAARTAFGESAGKTRTQLFKLYREKGVPCPVQLVWGSHDPLTSLDRGFGLFEIIAKKQSVTRFDIVNRAGNLPFREEPRAFTDVVAAFHAGVDARDSAPAKRVA